MNDRPSQFLRAGVPSVARPGRRALLSLCLLGAAQFATALPAFPDAQGFGACLSGGRGGAVLKVTNLANSGTGSLNWALAQPGPRIIVFGVSGQINGDVYIPHGDLTIAGQTARGAGITIHGHLYGDYGETAGNIVIRHLRIRAPMPDSEWPAEQHDTVQLSTQHGILLDHIDASHGVDEILDFWGAARDITIQWSAITFPVHGGGHPDGAGHNYGLINGPGGGRISLHHNLFAHNRSRTPALAEGPAEVINNVVYNAREGFVHHNPAAGEFNLVGNVYRDGPSAALIPFWLDPENGPPPSSYFSRGNRVDDPGVFVGIVDNPFTTPGFAAEYSFYCCGIDSGYFQSSAHNFGGAGHRRVMTHRWEDAYAQVLALAGAWPRDSTTLRAVSETTDRNGSWGNHRPADWMEGLTPLPALPDADNDGIPDAWETANGLNPASSGDNQTIMSDGYPAIESYLNGLADALLPVRPDYIKVDDFESPACPG